MQPTILTDAMRGSVEGVLAPYPALVEQLEAQEEVAIVAEEEQNG